MPYNPNNQNVQNYPNQQTQGYQQPQRYAQPQGYQQPRPAGAPSNPVPPSSGSSSLQRLIVIIVFIGIIGAFIFVGKNMFFPGIEPVDREVDEPRDTLTQVIPTGDINFAYNGFVTDFDTLLIQENKFELGEQILIYTLVDGFTQKDIPSSKSVKLTYGVEMLNENGERIDSMSNDRLYEVDKTFDEEIENYYFTATVHTNNLISGLYTLEVTVTDENSGSTSKDSIELTLEQPDRLRLDGPFLGNYYPEIPTFEEAELEYFQGDIVQTYLQVRGFKVEGTRPDIHVNLYITDENGELLPDHLYNDIFVANETFDVTPVTLVVNTAIPTGRLEPGTYHLEYIIEDFIADKSTRGTHELVIS